MHKFILSVLVLAVSCGLSMGAFAEESCIIHTNKEALKYIKTDDIPFRFAGLTIQLPKPDKASFTPNGLLLAYKSKNIFLYYMADDLKNNMEKDYNPFASYEEALGITAETEKNKEKVSSIRKYMDGCKGITEYTIGGIKYQIFGVQDKESLQKYSTNILILDKHSKSIDQISFTNFSVKEIKEILSTIKAID